MRHRYRRALAGTDSAPRYLLQYVEELLAERLDDVRRDFPLALDFGGLGRGALAHAHAAGRISRLISGLPVAGAASARGGEPVIVDQEALPLADARFDLVVAAATLHQVNDLPGTLIQIRRALRPDGLFLAAIPGGDTLHELRSVLLAAEMEVRGGASPRIAPFVDVRDAGALLQRAGFALPVVDLESVTVTFAHPLQLLADLRAMGQANVLVARDRRPLSRAVLARAIDLYGEQFSDQRGRIQATFQFLMLSGWAPAPDQPQPQRRGTGRINLAQALRVPDKPA